MYFLFIYLSASSRKMKTKMTKIYNNKLRIITACIINVFTFTFYPYFHKLVHYAPLSSNQSSNKTCPTTLAFAINKPRHTNNLSHPIYSKHVSSHGPQLAYKQCLNNLSLWQDRPLQMNRH